jgi:hypothetical protein
MIDDEKEMSDDVIISELLNGIAIHRIIIIGIK